MRTIGQLWHRAVSAGRTSPAYLAETDDGWREVSWDEAGQTVDAFISCLKYWNPGDRRQPNEVEIKRLGDDTFTVSAVLRSRSIFHFQVERESGYLVAVLRRVEYSLVTNAAYQQLTDAESKRAVVRGACSKP